MDPDIFKEQIFNFNLYNIFIILGFILLSLIFFKEEDQSLISQNEDTLSNLKFLFTDKQSLKIIASVVICNGLLVVLASLFNIIGVNQGFDSLFISITILIATLSGLLASILYTVLFLKVENHSKIFATLMTLTSLAAIGGILGTYYKNKWIFSVMFVLLGIFSFPLIPFMMEKHSLDCPNVSMNIINLSK
jgi:cyanate permease